MRNLSIAVMLGVFAFGCNSPKKAEEKKEEKPAATAKAEAKKPPVKKEDPVERLARSTRTQEDFEEQFEREITEENLEAEIAKLEQELAAPEEGTEAK